MRTLSIRNTSSVDVLNSQTIGAETVDSDRIGRAINDATRSGLWSASRFFTTRERAVAVTAERLRALLDLLGLVVVPPLRHCRLSARGNASRT